MNRQRIIIEMAQGADLRGEDATKAACRAVEGALRQVSLPLLTTLGIDAATVHIRITIGVPAPETVDRDAVRACLPDRVVEVEAVPGGLRVENPDTQSALLIASAAIEVFLPKDIGWTHAPGST